MRIGFPIAECLEWFDDGDSYGKVTIATQWELESASNYWLLTDKAVICKFGE